MISSTVNNGGYEVGIKFGGDSAIQINGQSINEFIDLKQDKATLFSDIYEIDSVYITTEVVDLSLMIEGSSWEQLGELQLSSGKTIYFWKRIA